jgi:hypothetical protein
MTKIVKAFTLRLDNGEKRSFAPGDHDLTDLPGREGKPKDYSDHFYVRAHSDSPVNAAPKLGSHGHVTMLRALAEKRRQDSLDADEALKAAEDLHAQEDLKMPFGKAALPLGASPIGPAVEGAARTVSPGQKELGDRDSNVGNQIEGPGKIVEDEATFSDELDAIDADAAAAEQEARAAAAREEEDVDEERASPRRRASLKPAIKAAAKKDNEEKSVD